MEDDDFEVFTDVDDAEKVILQKSTNGEIGDSGSVSGDNDNISTIYCDSLMYSKVKENLR